jgi:hypothetical protein
MKPWKFVSKLEAKPGTVAQSARSSRRKAHVLDTATTAYYFRRSYAEMV